MTANLQRLARILDEDPLEAQIRSEREDILNALKAKGEYTLTDSKGRAFRITAPQREAED